MNFTAYFPSLGLTIIKFRTKLKSLHIFQHLFRSVVKTKNGV